MLQPQRKENSIDDRVLTLEYGQEKTERHYLELKEKVDDVSGNITDIKNAVIGNRMNGESGIVQDLKKAKNEIYDLKVQAIKHELYFKQLSVVISLLVGGLITALIKIFI
jgi:hypothetical protein